MLDRLYEWAIVRRRADQAGPPGKRERKRIFLFHSRVFKKDLRWV
jgi:hypothetical protein